mmetsp:Transcript_51541/g.122599  ORF Transcript_51541/g.122599 Transcript_51541/m.122599 type:complete len:482 (+) Transcript_51541:97-1542(+)
MGSLAQPFQWCCSSSSSDATGLSRDYETKYHTTPTSPPEINMVPLASRASSRPADPLQQLMYSPRQRGETCKERKLTRQAFNLAEVDAYQKFDQWDVDGSGYLEKTEVEEMLREMARRAPTDNEVAWLMKVADKDNNGKICRKELLVALQAWHGYINLPPDLIALFAEFDTNKDEHLDSDELKGLLTRVNKRDVSDREVQQVMEVADLLSDGQIGRYEFLGALGAWYVAVGREPTPAMALAFLANNRTGGPLHVFVHWSMAIVLFFSAYFPLAAALRNTHCKMDIHDVLWADAILWVVFTFVVLMKGHWVELANCFIKKHTASKWLVPLSWSTMLLEVTCLTLLTIVELIGFWYVQQEQIAGPEEIEECERDATLPIDVPLSFKARSLRRYPSYIEFCQVWFTFNFVLNFVTILAYYAFLAWRYYQTVQAEKQLQAESEEDFSAAGTLEDGNEFTTIPSISKDGKAEKSKKAAPHFATCCS